jgi:hypothetical protein
VLVKNDWICTDTSLYVFMVCTGTAFNRLDLFEVVSHRPFTEEVASY